MAGPWPHEPNTEIAQVAITSIDRGTSTCEEEALRQAGHETTVVSVRGEELVVAPAREVEVLIVEYVQIRSGVPAALDCCHVTARTVSASASHIRFSKNPTL